MKKLMFALVTFGMIISQSSGFDVCAGDFLEKYEFKLGYYDTELGLTDTKTLVNWNYCSIDDCKKLEKEYKEIEKSEEASAYSNFLQKGKANGHYLNIGINAYMNYLDAIEVCGGETKK